MRQVGAEVDGVIAMTPAALAGFLELTGPIEAPGYPEQLSSENAERVLLHEHERFPKTPLEKRIEYDPKQANPARRDILWMARSTALVDVNAMKAGGGASALVSIADLIVLGGVAAVEKAGGSVTVLAPKKEEPAEPKGKNALARLKGPIEPKAAPAADAGSAGEPASSVAPASERPVVPIQANPSR